MTSAESIDAPPSAGAPSAGLGETMAFQAEVSRLLDIVAHALYSEREIFLRELISNASDASDKLRYLSATDASIGVDTSTARITLQADQGASTLTIADDGIGMTRGELVDNLGTIARSGTGRFMAQFKDEAKPDLSMIGQFGVGFYSAFMVADHVQVISRHVGSDAAWSWSSDGRGSFKIAPAKRATYGTTIILHIKNDAAEFLESERVKTVIRRYSDHVPLPIVWIEDGKEETVNAASALWTKPRSEITEEAATSFYRHLAHATDTPWATVHVRAEGVIEYSALLFVPGQRPFDLFHPDRRHGVKLYVRRVFITDEAKDLVPGYLRFVKGVVDSADLPLNVSRELLQASPMMAKIKANLTKKILAEIEKKAGDESYATFWSEFGAALKEGLYEDSDNRETLLKLVRFRTTAGEEAVSLDTYLSRMRPGQTAIYTASGEDPVALAASPQLEGFKAKGVEVLLLTDPIDEFWTPAVGQYKDTQFKSVTRGAVDLSAIDSPEGEKDAPKPEAASDGQMSSLIALFKLTLGEQVKDVRASERLTDSAACLVADDFGLDLRLERLLRQHKQLDKAAARILEINPRHPAIKSLAERVSMEGAADTLADAAHLLLDQARILEGEALPDPRAFARRLEKALQGN